MPAAALAIDPHRPFTVGLRDIGRRPGTSRELIADLDAPGDLAVGILGVPAGAPIALDLTLESVVEGIWVSGTASADLEGECGRCLAPVRQHVQADIAELFAYAESTTAHSVTDEGADEDDVRLITDEQISLEPVVRDALLIEAPLAPLCREDCEGLCPTCGERLEDLPDDHAHEVLDPRFAALAETFGSPEQSQSDGPV
ncbi:MAG: YceD family protein [Mycobacteriales bacterium]